MSNTMNSFYPQAYHDSTVKKLALDLINEENKKLIERGKIVVLPDNFSNEIAFNNLDGEISIKSMSETTRLLQNASKVDIENMELFFAQQNNIMKTIIDHEIAHGLEPMNKIRGFQIYNNKMLPKLMDGSLGVYDEISFEENRERLIDFMNVEFQKEYNPSPFEINRFKNFSGEYFFPNGNFEMTNRIVTIDNYISDISIENLMAGLHNNPKGMDTQFKNLRDLLYADTEKYSLLRSMQIYIDPRYKDSKELEKVMKDEDFQEFLNLNLNNIDLSNSFFKATTPEDLEQLRMVSIMNELRENVRKLREYAYKLGVYYKYKEAEEENEKERKIKKDKANINTLEDITTKTTTLAKIVYIKELEGDMNNEGLINQIVKDDKMINGFNYNVSEVKDLKDNKKNIAYQKNSEEDNLILPKATYIETINAIGHNKDFGSDLNDMYIEIKDLIKSNLELKQFKEKFDLRDEETIFVNNVLRKEVKEDYSFNDDNLKVKREALIEDLKNSDHYKVLKNKVSKIEEELNQTTEKVFYTKDEIQKSKTINIFIEDNIEAKNTIISNDYNSLDYQIANAMIIKELFENSENIQVNILNIGHEEASLSYIYDSSFEKDVEIENNNILTLDGIKEEKLNEDSLLEAIVKLKSISNESDMVNLILSNNENLNFIDNKIFDEDTFKKIYNNNVIVDINNIKDQELTKILANSLEESFKIEDLNNSSI